MRERSVTRWIGDLRASGDAARYLWDRYFLDLVHVARGKLRNQATGVLEEYAEDVALSAFDSFCRGAAHGRYPELIDWDHVWRLLSVITVRKAYDQIAREQATKRGGGRVFDEGGLAGRDRSDLIAELDSFVGREPSPELAAMVAEEYQWLCSRLEDESLRRILELRLEGYTRAEIAARMNLAVKTVTRKLGVIRQVWLDGEEES